jgi:cysteine desulfuration protein SufE
MKDATDVPHDRLPSTKELLEAFADMPDFDDRVDYLIDLGRELPSASALLHAEQNLVQGCMSTVWLRMEVADPNRSVTIEADSDSQIIKGLLVVLLSFYRSKTAQQIVDSDVSSFLKQLELDQHLSPQRRNGLFAMIKRINAIALSKVS